MPTKKDLQEENKELKKLLNSYHEEVDRNMDILKKSYDTGMKLRDENEMIKKEIMIVLDIADKKINKLEKENEKLKKELNK